MKYLPFERITYRTHLSEQEVLKRLSGFVEPKKFGLGKNYIKEYEGSVNENSFEISKVIQYRNSFLPQIRGRIQKENGGTQIQVTMSLHVFVLFFFICLVFICPAFLHRFVYKRYKSKRNIRRIFSSFIDANICLYHDDGGFQNGK